MSVSLSVCHTDELMPIQFNIYTWFIKFFFMFCMQLGENVIYEFIKIKIGKYFRIL